MGGGLTPAVGLHNLLEPLACRVPVVFGSHHGKAGRVASEMLRLGAGIQIDTGDRLRPILAGLLASSEHRRRLTDAAEVLLDLHRGAADRHADRIRGFVA